MEETTLLFLIMTSAFVSGGVITNPPVDSAACYGGIITFHCGSDEGSGVANIQWIVNGEDLIELSNDEITLRGISTQTSITDDYAASNLTIVGVPVNDGITIECLMICYSFVYDTEFAIFTVTDIPPVTNLSIDFTGTIMNATWDTPSVLPVDYHYLINIANGNITVSNATVDPVYKMSTSSCSSNYTVSVSVVDIGYTQLQSVPVNRTEQSNNIEALDFHVELDPKSSAVEFEDSIDCYISLLLEIIVTSPWSLPCIIPSIIVNTTSLYPSGVYSDVITLTDIINDRYATELLSFGPFSERFIGKLILALETDLTDDVLELFISTFNTQDFNISTDPYHGTVKTTCIFASNSSADGCQVIFTPILTTAAADTVTIFIAKDINGLISTGSIRLKEGNYMVTVHDVVEGEIVQPAAYSTEYEITHSSLLLQSAAATIEFMSSMTVISFQQTPSLSVSSPPGRGTSSAASYKILTSIFIVTAGSVVVVSVITAGLLVVCKIKRHKKNIHSQACNIVNTMTQNPAYERVDPFTLQKVKMTSNMAYETVIVT